MPQEVHSPILETPFETLAPASIILGGGPKNEHFNESLTRIFIAMDQSSVVS